MSSFVRRFRLLSIYCLLALPLVAFGAAHALKMAANSPLDWVTDSFPARREYDEFRRAFGSGDTVIVSWPGCVLESDALRRFAHILRRSPSFVAEDGEPYFERVATGSEAVAGLMARPPGLSAKEAASRLAGSLVGADGKTTCAVVSFTGRGLRERKEVVALMRRALEEHCGVPEPEQRMAGPIMEGLTVDEASQDSLERFGPLSCAVLLLCCVLGLPTVRSAATVFVLSLVATGVALALVYYAGDEMTALLIVLPPLVQTATISGGMHLVNYYHDAARERPGPDAAWRALRRGWLPCVMSSSTTAVGTATLAVSLLAPIRAFAVYASIGTMAAVGLLLVFIPSLYAIWPERLAPGEGGRRPGTDSANASRHSWSWLFHLLQRHHAAVAVGSLALMVGVGLGVTRLRSSLALETLFHPESRVLTDCRWLEERMGPLAPIEVVVRFDAKSRLSARQELRLVGQVEDALEELPDVGAVFSAVDCLPDAADFAELPPAALEEVMRSQLAAAEPRFAEMGLFHAARGTRTWRVTARISALGDHDYERLLGDVRRSLAPLLCDSRGRELPGASVECTGVMPLVQAIQREMLRNLFSSFLWAFVIIGVAMSIIQEGVLGGLVSMVSDVFPVVLLFGILGWWSHPIDIGIVKTASLALGICIDNPLHFLNFFRRELARGKTLSEAVDGSLRGCGTAMLLSNMACAAGTLVFALSDFMPTVRFAWMMLALLAAGAFADLVVLPAILLGPCGRLIARTFSPPAGPGDQKGDVSTEPGAALESDPIAARSRIAAHSRASLDASDASADAA